MTPESFFVSRSPSSVVKSRIVWKYFDAYLGSLWNKTQKYFTFADLFCGPGAYDDNLSTPMELLDMLDRKAKYRSRIRLVFNDENVEYVDRLAREVSARLAMRPFLIDPSFSSVKIGSPASTYLISSIESPSVTFLDPFGYRGVTRDLVRHLTTGFAAEVILFFNFNRVNAAISNPLVKHHMEKLFEPERLEAINAELEKTSSGERPAVIVRELGHSFGEGADRHVFSYRFMSPNANRVSHYLLLVTKNPLGIKIFSDICSSEGHGFVFSTRPMQLDIFESGQSRADTIAQAMLAQYRCETQSLEYVVTHYDHSRLQSHPTELKNVVRGLEESGIVAISPAAGERRRGRDGRVTMGNRIMVTFPCEEANNG